MLLSNKPGRMDGVVLSSEQPVRTLQAFVRRLGWRVTSTMALQLFACHALEGMDCLRAGQGRLWSFSRLAAEFGVTLLPSANFNEPAVIEDINRQRIDVLVSAGCDQIFRQPLIDAAAHSCINIHGSPLPDYRGLNPLFQMMLAGEREHGVSLHKMVEAIDAGPIVLMQRYPVDPSESYFRLACRAARESSVLLKRYIDGENDRAVPQDRTKIRHPYRSWPEKAEVRRFLGQGCSLVRIDDLADALLMRI